MFKNHSFFSYFNSFSFDLSIAFERAGLVLQRYSIGIFSCFCEWNMQLPHQQCLFCQVCAHDNQHINSHKHRAAAQLGEHSCCCLPWAGQKNILYRAVFEPGCSPPIINSTALQTQTPRILGGSSATPQLNGKISKSWVEETQQNLLLMTSCWCVYKRLTYLTIANECF